MTTYVPVIINDNAAPPWSGQVTLDGNPYKITVIWNIAGQRWYVSIADSSGTVAWYGPLIGSPADMNILLAPGVFTTSTILYRASTGNLEVTP